MCRSAVMGAFVNGTRGIQPVTVTSSAELSTDVYNRCPPPYNDSIVISSLIGYCLLSEGRNAVKNIIFYILFV